MNIKETKQNINSDILSFALCVFFALNFIIHNLLLQPRTDMFTLDATRILKNCRLYCSRDIQKIHLSGVYLIWGLYHKARLMGYEQCWALGQSFSVTQVVLFQSGEITMATHSERNKVVSKGLISNGMEVWYFHKCFYLLNALRVM